MKHTLTLLTVLLLAPVAGLAQSPPNTNTVLGVGDPAPKLQANKWIQGEPVKAFEKDKAYLVEFWATWCGPCVTSIPHVNAIAGKFKDEGLVVIGQNVWENDQNLVKPFVENMGSKMTYRVALDDKDSMAETWLTAAGKTGIPCAFLVGKDGKVAWIGHPMDLEESVIEQVLAGTFDVAKAAAEQKTRQAVAKLEVETRQAAAKLEAEKAAAADEPERRKATELTERLMRQFREKKWDAAETTLAELLKSRVVTGNTRRQIDSLRFYIVLFRDTLDTAADWAAKNCEAQEEAPAAAYAFALLGQRNLTDHAVDVALKLATRADEAAENKSALVLDVLARATFVKGDHAKAMELQQKAVALASDAKQKQELQSTLDSYKQGKLPAETVVLDEMLANRSNAKLNALFVEEHKRADRIKGRRAQEIEERRAQEIEERRAQEAEEKENALNKLGAEVNQAMATKKWDTAETALNEIIERAPELSGSLAGVRAQILLGSGDIKAALALAKERGGNEKNPCHLNSIAEAILLSENLNDEALAVAYEMAVKANEGDLKGDCRASHLYQLARACFMKGDKTKAVELAQKALGFADDANVKKQLQSALDSYKAGKLPKAE
jgi:thiol-disulfide isomerase/thioredoxin